jgi:hypothetical protein
MALIKKTVYDMLSQANLSFARPSRRATNPHSYSSPRSERLTGKPNVTHRLIHMTRKDASAAQKAAEALRPM